VEDEEEEESAEEEEEEEAAFVEEAEGYRLWRSERSVTGYKGVARVGRSFRSSMNQPGQKTYHLGTFATAVEAAVAYAKAAKKMEVEGEEHKEEEVDTDLVQEAVACPVLRENTLRADVLCALLAGKSTNDDIVEHVWHCGKATTRGADDMKKLRGDVVTVLSKETRAGLPLWKRTGDGRMAVTHLTTEGRQCGRAMAGEAVAMCKEAQGPILCGINGCPLSARHAGNCLNATASSKRTRTSVASSAVNWPKKRYEERDVAPELVHERERTVSIPGMVGSATCASTTAAMPATCTSTSAASTSTSGPVLPTMVKRLRVELEFGEELTFKEVVESAERQLLGETSTEGVPLIKRARQCLNELGVE